MIRQHIPTRLVAWIGLACILAVSAAVPSTAAAVEFEPFTNYETGGRPASAEIADVTSDGRKDVLLSTSFVSDPENDFKLFLFEQQTDGSLSPTKLVSHIKYGDTADIAIGDFDDDGDTDAAIGTDVGIDLFPQSNGTLSDHAIVAGSPVDILLGLVSADVNGDGRDDLIANAAAGLVVMTQRPAGAGFDTSAVLPSESGGEAVHARDLDTGDVNGDGLVDIVALIRSTGNALLHQRLAGGGYETQSLDGRTSAGAFAYPNGLAVGDVTGDGRDDVVLSRGDNATGDLAVWAQESVGELVRTPAVYGSPNFPEPVEVLDMDLDGRTDVVTLHGGFLAAGVFTQLPSGLLGQEQPFEIPYATVYENSGLALGDVNSDGYPDIAAADYLSGLVLLRQVPPNRPPDCSAAAAAPATIAVSKGSLVPIAITGLTDPDGDPITVRITGVTQDEPVRGRGDRTAPDAALGPGPGDARLRPERSQFGDGRVYRVSFEASDATDSCAGKVTIAVPRHKGGAAFDSAPPVYDSLSG